MPGGKHADAIGIRGEALFTAAIMDFDGGADPLFRARHLGDKWPLVDFYVELCGAWSRRRPFFLVQAKSTRRGYTTRANRLKVTVEKVTLAPLKSYRIPVFLAGIDEQDERVFMVSVRARGLKRLSSLSTVHEVNAATRRRIFDEVAAFWRDVTLPATTSSLREPKWRYG